MHYYLALIALGRKPRDSSKYIMSQSFKSDTKSIESSLEVKEEAVLKSPQTRVHK